MVNESCTNPDDRMDDDRMDDNNNKFFILHGEIPRICRIGHICFLEVWHGDISVQRITYRHVQIDSSYVGAGGTSSLK